MCWANKCCFFVPLDIGCIIVGVVGFVMSTIMTIGSLALMIIEGGHEHHMLLGKPHTHFLQPYLSFGKTTIDICLRATFLDGLMWMLFSILLILGIRQNRPSFIIFSFGLGLFLTICSQLASLLLILSSYWIAAIVLFIFTLFIIHYLVVIHTVYEQMVRGKHFGATQQIDTDQECILENESQENV